MKHTEDVEDIMKKINRLCAELEIGNSPEDQLIKTIEDIQYNGEIVRDKKGKPIINEDDGCYNRKATPKQEKRFQELSKKIMDDPDALKNRIDKLCNRIDKLCKKITAEHRGKHGHSR